MSDAAPRGADRRGADRPGEPVCRKCKHPTQMTVVARTDDAVYFGCGECGEVVVVKKP